MARGKQGRVEPPAEAAASEDACVVKSTLSFEEMKAAHADRLKSIKVLSLLIEAAVEKIMAEVDAPETRARLCQRKRTDRPDLPWKFVPRPSLGEGEESPCLVVDY